MGVNWEVRTVTNFDPI